MATFKNTAELAACVGQEVAVSEWTQITQSQVQKFAEATGDFQWIHVDVERAKAGPFGAPIAHGFLTLSLIPKFFDECLVVTEPAMGVNYGLNKVRFMAPVPVGSRVRARLRLLACEPVDGPGGIEGMQMTWGATLEREGSDKPVCVAEMLARRYPQKA
jgi:acyl dehydratase